VLYRCDCSAFNLANNNYRKFCIALATAYTKYFFSHNTNINNMGIVLFESGGLLDEAIIIDKILKYLIDNNYSVNIIIYIIEPNLEDNISIQAAYNYFNNRFFKHKEITIHHYKDFSFLKKTIGFMKFDYLLFLSLDPYEYLCLDYFKNEGQDVAELSEKISFLLYISMFAINGFFYDVELFFFIFNKELSNNTLTKYRLFGRKNAVSYVIKTIKNIK